MSQLERQLGLWAVVAISVSTMLGSGLFVLPGLAAAKAGPSVFLAYLFAGLCVFPAGLSKAELATAMPTSGGTYVYLDRAFGPLVGTIAGLGLWLSLLLKSAFALVGFSAYLVVLADIPVKAAAMIMLAVIVVINMGGVRKVGQIQSIIVLLAVISLVVLFVLGLGEYDPKRLEPLFSHGGGGFLAAAAFVFVSYAGVTKVAAFAEEVKNPQRNLPLGILLSLFIAVVLYGTVALILVAVIPMEILATDLAPIYTLSKTLGGRVLGTAGAVLGVATMASMANGGLLAASRFPYAMSRDHLLPRVFSTLHKRFLTPTAAIFLSAATISIAILFFEIEKIAKLASAFLIILYISENITVIVLREVGPRWYRPSYRSPLYPFTQISGVVLSGLLLVVLGPVAAMAGLAIAVPGAVLFLLYGKSRTDRKGVLSLRGQRKELLRTASSEMKSEEHLAEDSRVVVALLGSEGTPELLVEHAAALAEGGGVQVVLILEIPEQTALHAMDDDPKIGSIRRRVCAVADAKDIDINFNVVASRDLVKTVFELSNQIHCDWLVMSWSGRSRYSITFTNPLGWLKSHLACNLAVYRDAGVRYFRKIVVYAEPGPHDALIATTADHLATEHCAELTFVRFVPIAASEEQAQSEADYLEQLCELCSEGAKSEVIRGSKEVETITSLSAGYDLLVTAEPTATFVGQMFGGRQNELTHAAACSVLRLRTPRIETHRTVVPPRRADKLVIEDVLESKCVVAQVEKMKKQALFERIAESFSDSLPSLERSDILRELLAREARQNTAVGHGVALPHATDISAERTYLGIFTTRVPIDYQAPDGEGVDVFFATIGPPRERHTHLQLLASVSSMVLKTNLLSLLRKAQTSEEIVEALRAAQAALQTAEEFQR